MAVSSKIGKALELVASTIGALAGVTWGTAPSAKWFPDFERAKLEEMGLTAFVCPAVSESDPASRANTPRQRLSAEVGVFKPMADQAFDSGDAVMVVAEAIEVALHRKTITSGSSVIACTEARLDPVISAEYAKQYQLWCAIIKLEIET